MSLDSKNTGWRPHEIQNNLEKYLIGFEFLRPLTKQQRITAALIVASRAKRPITRFDAIYINDFVLNSTISSIGSRDNIQVDRCDVKRPTKFGTDVTCCEYWLSPESIYKAESLLIGLSNLAAA